MVPELPDSLTALAAAIHEAHPRGFVDLYLERVADTVWELADGKVVARHTLLREGAAARFAHLLRSSDGLTRLVLADLLGVAGRRLPPLVLPPYPPPPALPEFGDRAPVVALRRRWRWAAVIRPAQPRELLRPPLWEVTLVDGQRLLATSPPTGDVRLPPLPPPAARAVPDSGPTRCLLAPAAAAVLLHEAIGHALEGDLVLDGGRHPLHQAGVRVGDPGFDLVDDPTRKELPGAFSADDEGTPAHRTVLVENGAVVGVLADRTSAPRLGVRAGNARRSSVHAWPRPRVSNLVVEGAEVAPEPAREEAALEIESVRAGSLELRSGELRLVSRVAWQLRHGRRVRALGPFVLAGRVERIVPRLRVAGPAEVCGEPGWCGKGGEIVPVGAVAPWLLVDGLEVR